MPAPNLTPPYQIGTDQLPHSVEFVSSVVEGGNLGSTYSLALSAQAETWLVGTLTANLALTLTSLASGAKFKLLLTQDGTGGRTLTINGTSVTIASGASALSIVEGYYDGTTVYLAVGGNGSPLGSAGGDLSGTYPNPKVASIESPLIDNLLPWRVPLDVLSNNFSASSGDFSTAYVAHLGAGLLYQPSPAQNDYIAFDLILAAGTWSLELVGPTQNNAGIITVEIDGVATGGTADFYSSSAQSYDHFFNISFTVATGGKHRLTLIVATKNASSSGYQLGLQMANLQRTA